MALTPEEKSQLIDAIYQAQVKQARELVAKIEFEAKDLPDLFRRLKGESETAQILVFSSYLEDRVQTLLKSRLQHVDSANIEDEPFGSNGPLSNFGNQISLSYQLGWISPEQKRKLVAFKKVRNEFAHRAFKVRLSDQKIAEQFTIIDYNF